MKLIPWILTVLLAGGCYFLYSQNQQKDRQLAELHQQAESLENKISELEDSHDDSVSKHEVDRLRKEAEEVYKLRGEIAQLRRENQQLASQLKLAQQNDPFAANQNDPFNDFPPPLTPQEEALAKIEIQHAEACVDNLKVLDEAKNKWAVDNNKTGGDPATQNDVLPLVPNQTMPLCPSGGTYVFNEVGVPVTCSVEGHSLLP